MDATHLVQGVVVEDAQVVAAPIADEHVPVVGRHRHVLGHHPDLADRVDGQRRKAHPVHEARAQTARAAAIVGALGPEVRAVHRIVGREHVAVRVIDCRLHRRAANHARVAADPELREVDAVGNRLHEGASLVVHGDAVVVDHVLGEHQAPARGVLARVVGAHHHAPDPGLQDRIRAGRRLTAMAARLERHVQRGVVELAPRGATDHLHLGMWSAERAVVALGDRLPVGGDHGSHERIRADPAPPLLG